MNKERKALIYGALAVLSWSTVATAFKIAGQYMSPFQMVTISTIASFLILLFVLTLQKHWASVRSLSFRQWQVLALLGLLNPVAYYLVLFMAYSKLPAQIAQPINYTWPILLLILLAIFNRQRIPAAKYIGMALSLIGVACISFGGKELSGGISIAGIGWGFLSALLWASYWLLNKKYCADIDATTSFFGTFLFGSIYMLGGSMFMGWPPMNMESLLSGCYIGAFEMAIPFVFFGIALRTSSNPVIINQMCYLSPFLSLFFISMILGETIAMTTMVGLALIVSGIVFNEYFAVRRIRA